MGSFSCLTYHFVFATKYRKRIISEHFQERLYEYIGGIIRSNKGHLIEIGGVEDHVHILAGLSPALAVSDVIRDVKASSSKWMTEELNIERFKWQKGFGAFTVSFDRIASARSYIRNQKEHHEKKTFQEEYIEFLERPNIEYNPEFLFEGEHVG